MTKKLKREKKSKAEIKEERKQLNVSLTQIVTLHEVLMRLNSQAVDNAALKYMLKKTFQSYYEEGIKVNSEFRKYINQDKRFEDPEEEFDQEADFLYDLILNVYQVKTVEGREKILKFIKMVANE